MGSTLMNVAVALVHFPDARRRVAAPRLTLPQMGRTSYPPVLRLTIGAGLLSTIVQSAFLLAFPLFLARLLGFGASQAAVTLTVLFAFAAAFQVLALAPLVHRLGDRRAAILGFSLVVPAPVPIGLVRTFPLVLVAGTIIMWG